MIVDRDQLEPIVKGRTTEIHLRLARGQDPPEKDTFQAIQGAVGKNATCTVHIDRVRHHEEGGWLIAFHLAEDVPARLLGKSGGYTTDPAYAMPHEPEAVDEATQVAMTAESHTKAGHRRQKLRAEQNRLSAEDRVKAYMAEARIMRIDVGKEKRVFDQLLRRGKDPSNQVHVIRRKLDDNQDRRAA